MDPYQKLQMLSRNKRTVHSKSIKSDLLKNKNYAHQKLEGPKSEIAIFIQIGNSKTSKITERGIVEWKNMIRIEN